MKKIMLLTTLIAFATISFCQQITQRQDRKETDFNKKSKNQRTAAWILLGSGVALMAGGYIAHVNYVNSQNDFGNAIIAAYGVDDRLNIVGAGVLVAAGSIPLFIASARNKKKANAASVFIDVEKARVLQGTALSYQAFPVVGFRVRL